MSIQIKLFSVLFIAFTSFAEAQTQTQSASERVSSGRLRLGQLNERVNAIRNWLESEQPPEAAAAEQLRREMLKAVTEAQRVEKDLRRLSGFVAYEDTLSRQNARPVLVRNFARADGPMNNFGGPSNWHLAYSIGQTRSSDFILVDDLANLLRADVPLRYARAEDVIAPAGSMETYDGTRLYRMFNEGHVNWVDFLGEFRGIFEVPTANPSGTDFKRWAIGVESGQLLPALETSTGLTENSSGLIIGSPHLDLDVVFFNPRIREIVVSKSIFPILPLGTHLLIPTGELRAIPGSVGPRYLRRVARVPVASLQAQVPQQSLLGARPQFVRHTREQIRGLASQIIGVADSPHSAIFSDADGIEPILLGSSEVGGGRTPQELYIPSRSRVLQGRTGINEPITLRLFADGVGYTFTPYRIALMDRRIFPRAMQGERASEGLALADRIYRAAETTVACLFARSLTEARPGFISPRMSERLGITRNRDDLIRMFNSLRCASVFKIIPTRS